MTIGKDLTPKFTVEVEFAYRDLFPPDDPLAQWVANVSRAANDLLLANRRLAAGLESGESQDEVIYDIRAVSTHAWELAEFLRNSDDDKIQRFIADLPAEVHTDYAAALDALQAPDSDGPLPPSVFKRLLASARDQSTHYSVIGHKLLRRGLTILGEDIGGKPNTGKIHVGATFKDFYADFATELEYQLFFKLDGDDIEPFKQFASSINKVMGHLIRFTNAAVHVYLNEHRSNITLTELKQA